MRQMPTLKRPYAPLVWVVLGIFAGYGAAQAWPECVGSSWGTAAALAISIGGIILGGRAWKRKPLRHLGIVLAVAGLAALAYHSVDKRQRTDLAAPMEATVDVRIKQRFALRAESGRVSGLGQALRVSPDLGSLSNPNIYYSARWELPETMRREDVVRFRGLLSPIANNHDASGFDGYLEKSHVQWKLNYATAMEVVEPSPLWMQGVESMREGAIATLSRSWGPNNGLLPAMVIGAKAEISKQQKENFVRSGTMHLLAISGLNVMVVAAGFILLGKLLRFRGLGLAVAVVIATGLYAQIAGAAPSVMRAWGMVAVGSLGYAMRRQVNVWSVVVLTALISLVVEPLSLWHAGWRLSFGVVAGMVLGMNAFERIARIERLPRWGANLVRAVMVSIIAGVSVAPMTAVYFGLAQPWGWALNTVSVIIASWVTLLGMASLLLGWLPWVPEALNTVANGLLGLLEQAIGLYLHIPGAVLEVHAPQWVEVAGTLSILTIFYILARFWPRRDDFG